MQLQNHGMPSMDSCYTTKCKVDKLQPPRSHLCPSQPTTSKCDSAVSNGRRDVTTVSGSSPVRVKESQVTVFDTETLDNLTQDLAYKVLGDIFSRVRKADVRQVSGRTEFNVGELTMEGVTRLITACELSSGDVFLDIGSGIGNVVAQVTLQSKVRQAIGLEIRQEVASLGLRLIEEARQTNPQLSRVCVLEGDIRELEENLSAIANTTVLYTNNYLFAPGATLAIHRLCCRLRYLRIVVLGAQACPRHRLRCTNEFCFVWKEQPEILYVGTEFRQTPFQLYTYIKA
jgi:hypothetical protein